ncbi:MAG: enoyl-CoA hydratase-related protein [Dehalococcoidia bacterium]
MQFEYLTYSKESHIVTLTLNRPERLNSISPPMNLELWEALNTFREDKDAWVCILTGAGDRAFCAGNDLKWRSENPGVETPGIIPGTEYQSNPKTPGPAGTLPTELWKPLIAAVHGYAVGGGMELTMHCDIVIASEDAKFGVPEIKNIGGVPGGSGILRLQRQLPYKVALWMLMSGEFMSADYMYSLGYVNEVVNKDDLLSTARKYAEILCNNPPIGVQTAKEVAIRSLDLPIDHPPTAWQYLWTGLTDKMRNSEDAHESRQAWLEKRKPNYKNE